MTSTRRSAMPMAAKMVNEGLKSTFEPPTIIKRNLLKRAIGSNYARKLVDGWPAPTAKI